MPRARGEEVERARGPGWGSQSGMAPRQGPWAMGLEGGRDKARWSLNSHPFGGRWEAGGGGRRGRDWVLEEQGLKGQRHWWETDRRTDSRTTQKTWGP